MGGILEGGCRGTAGDGKGSRQDFVHKEGKNRPGLVLNLMQSRCQALLKWHVPGALKGGEYFPRRLREVERADLACARNWEGLGRGCQTRRGDFIPS